MAEGVFGFDAELDVAEEESAPSLPEEAVLLRSGRLLLSGEAEVTVIHLLLPAEEAPEALKVLVLGGDGTWRTVLHKISGSYVVFDWSAEDISFALIREETGIAPVYYVAAAGALLLAVIVVTAAVRARKKKQAPKEASE